MTALSPPAHGAPPRASSPTAPLRPTSLASWCGTPCLPRRQVLRSPRLCSRRPRQLSLTYKSGRPALARGHTRTPRS
eukprot:scaffold14989_cov113-Isochrysis_galbana.AAC.1